MEFQNSVITVSAAILLSSTPLYAATITTTVSSGTLDTAVSPDYSGDGQVNVMTSDLVVSKTTNGSDATSSAGSELDIDLTSGLIKFGASGQAGARPDNTGRTRSEATGIAQFDIEETFTVTGSGSVTFMSDFDGLLSRTAPSPGISTSNSFQLRLELGNVTQNTVTKEATEILGVLLPQTTNDIFDSISVSIDVSDGDELFLRHFGSAGIFASSLVTSSASVLSDFTQTAALSFSTSNGVQLAASDPNFLSGGTTGPGIAGQVPLPAGLPLLLAGLGGLFGLRKPKETNSA